MARSVIVIFLYILLNAVIKLIIYNATHMADTLAKIIMQNNIELTKEEWKSIYKEKTDNDASKLIAKWNSR